MNIPEVNNTTFQGYDARRLKGFLMSGNPFGIATEMKTIAKKEGFELFFVDGAGRRAYCTNSLIPESNSIQGIWAQDLWTFVKNKILTLETSSKTLALIDFFNLKEDFTQKIAKSDPKIKKLTQEIWNLYSKIVENRNKNSKEQIENSKTLASKKAEIDRLQQNTHIAGGNIFIVKGNNGDEAIIGEKELEKFSISEIKSMYNVKKLTILPEMDYHLDLFIRPLNNKKVLLADDKMTLSILNEGLEKFINCLPTISDSELNKYECILSEFIQLITGFENVINENKRADTEKIAKILNKKGFDVIRVPGRVYDMFYNFYENGNIPKHYCNYINANVLINKNDDLVYITNKSRFLENIGLTPEISKKIGFDFEQSFIDSISPYVKKEHIYFIEGKDNFVSKEMLTEYQGGIHCTCAEIPLE